MKICILTTSFPRWRDDTTAPFILDAARGLQDIGLEVKVIAMHCPGCKTHENWDGIEIIRRPYLPEKFEVLQAEGGGLPVVWKKYPFAKLAVMAFAAVQFITVLREARDCAVVHANWSLSGMICWASQLFDRRPFVVTVHGSDLFQVGEIKWVRWLTRVALNRAKRVIAVSQALADAAIGLGIKPELVEVIPDGVNTNKFFPLDGIRQNYLLYIGSFIRRKGVEYLIKAMPFIIQKYPTIKLVLVGDGPLKAEYQGIIKELNIHESICFAGLKSQDEVSALLQKAAVLVLPSVEEGLGVVLLEALSSGLPCVASDAGGIRDVITPDVGILVAPGDAHAIGEAVNDLLGDPEKRMSMSLAARKRAVEHYEWRLIAHRLLDIYQRVISKDNNDTHD